VTVVGFAVIVVFAVLAGPAPVGENDALVNGPVVPRARVVSLATKVYSLPMTPEKVHPATFTVPADAVRPVHDDKVPPEPDSMARLMVSAEPVPVVTTPPVLLLIVTIGCTVKVDPDAAATGDLVKTSL
jgi:hypothetical protein